MLEEQIILLIKQSRHSEAIKKYVDSGEFEKAEEFCLSKDKSNNSKGGAGLITTLLSIYFEYYATNMAEAKKMKDDGNISGYAQQNEKAQKYETLALNLMMNQKAKSHLDPLIVLNSIPDDWEIITEHRDVI